MSPPTRVILMAALGLIMSATAQAQQTERERQEAAQDETLRIEAVMADMVERGEDLNLRHANPREITEYCQNTLPKLDDIFRVQMMYAPPELKPEFQRYFIELRQKIINSLVLAQLALSIPSSTPSPGQ
jgi:hypothetical protein